MRSGFYPEFLPTLCYFPANTGGVIGTAIIHDHDFIRQGFIIKPRSDFFESLGKAVAFIESRNHHAYIDITHVSPQSGYAQGVWPCLNGPRAAACSGRSWPTAWPCLSGPRAAACSGRSW